MTVSLVNELDSFTFESPKYPQPYCEMHSCKWSITTPQNLGLKISMSDFSVQDGDFLYLFSDDQELPFAACTGLECGDMLTGQNVIIQFVSDPIPSAHTGFQGTVTVVKNYCPRMMADELAHVNEVSYSEQRQDNGQIPVEATATITCADGAKVDGTSESITAVIPCLSPSVKWETDLSQACIPTCIITKISALNDLLEVSLCELGYEAEGMIQSGHNITVRHYDLIHNQFLHTDIFTCVDGSWAPHEIKCHQDLKILLLGGDDQGSIEVYHPTKPHLNQLLDIKMKTPRVGHISALLPGGSVLSVGGRSIAHDAELSRCELFFLVNNTVADCPPLPSPRTNLASAMLNGILHICGGRVGTHKWFKECKRFLSNAWQPMPAMRSERSDFAMAALDGELYAIGGHILYESHVVHNGVNIDWTFTVERYSENWEQLVFTLTSRRCNHTAAVAKGKVYVCGGVQQPATTDPLPFEITCERYDALEHELIAGQNMASHPVMVSMMDDLYLMGGDGDGSVQMYDTAEEQWHRLENLIYPRKETAAVVIP